MRLNHLNSTEDITRSGFGSVIVFHLEIVETLGLTTIFLFNRKCRMEIARPDYHNA